MRPIPKPLMTVLSLASIASLSLLSGAGSAAPAAGSDAPVAAASNLYVRQANGQATIAGRRVIVRAFLYNDYMPPIDPRSPGLGSLQVFLERNDPRGLPVGITRVTAEITQGRLRWRGTLPPDINPLADNAAFADLIGPSYFARNVRTFPLGSKVNVNLTFRVGNRDHKVTVRNVEVGGVY